MRADDGPLVSNVICQALTGEDITVYGDGNQTRSFCFVADIVDGLIRLMESDVGDGPVNLGNPKELTVVDLVQRIIALSGSSSRIVRKPLPEDDPRRRRPDIQRARGLLGWEPKIPLQQGLEATIKWLAGDRRDAAKGSSHSEGEARLGKAGVFAEAAAE